MIQYAPGARERHEGSLVRRVDPSSGWGSPLELARLVLEWCAVARRSFCQTLKMRSWFGPSHDELVSDVSSHFNTTLFSP